MSRAVYPSPRSLRTKSTVKRRPRIVGLPLQTVGSIWIRSKAIMLQYVIPSHVASPEKTSPPLLPSRPALLARLIFPACLSLVSLFKPRIQNSKPRTGFISSFRFSGLGQVYGGPERGEVHERLTVSGYLGCLARLTFPPCPSLLVHFKFIIHNSELITQNWLPPARSAHFKFLIPHS